MDGLVDASKEPFVHFYECPMPFCGSPADMVHHLMDACSGHCWPLAENIKYDTYYRFTMPESLEDHRRLLVSEEDVSVFLLIMGTGLIERTWTLGSWDYPANVDLENPWHPLPADATPRRFTWTYALSS